MSHSDSISSEPPHPHTLDWRRTGLCGSICPKLCLLQQENKWLYGKIDTIYSELPWQELSHSRKRLFHQLFLCTHTECHVFFTHSMKTPKYLMPQERNVELFLERFSGLYGLLCVASHWVCVWVSGLYMPHTTHRPPVSLTAAEQRQHSVMRFNIRWWREIRQCVKAPDSSFDWSVKLLKIMSFFPLLLSRFLPTGFTHKSSRL